MKNYEVLKFKKLIILCVLTFLLLIRAFGSETQIELPHVYTATPLEQIPTVQKTSEPEVIVDSVVIIPSEPTYDSAVITPPETTYDSAVITPSEPISDSVVITSSEPIFDISIIKPDGRTIMERFNMPEGFVREVSETESFAYYLQTLPLKPIDAMVKYFDGREKQRDVYLSVVDFTLGDRDLQQCADAVMRLRAEYLYTYGRYDEICFNFVSGFSAEFKRWAEGYDISVDGSSVSWVRNDRNNTSYESFQKYLDIVYAYASTLSLEKELTAKPLSDLAIGDVFIKGGSPGHCVIVVDMAVKNDTNEKIFMLAQSYMPAQDIHILKSESEGSPWFSANIEDVLNTPEWTFKATELKTWS